MVHSPRNADGCTHAVVIALCTRADWYRCVITRLHQHGDEMV